MYGWIPTNSFYRFSLIRGLGLSRKEVGERLIYLFLNIIPFPFFQWICTSKLSYFFIKTFTIVFFLNMFWINR